MSGPRVQRVAERIREEAADIIRTRLKDPRVGFATVTSVDVSGDLRHARVYVSVLGDEAERRATLDALDRARGFVRTELGARLKLFHTPEVVFEFDHSIEQGARIAEILHGLDHVDQTSAPGSDAGANAKGHRP